MRGMHVKKKKTKTRKQKTGTKPPRSEEENISFQERQEEGGFSGWKGKKGDTSWGKDSMQR